MGMEALIVLLVVGAIAGWLAGMIMKGGGMGLIGNIVVGVIGAFVGNFALNALGISLGIGNPIIGSIVVSLIGALILLFVLGLVRR